MPCPLETTRTARALVLTLANGLPFDERAMLRAVTLAGQTRLIPAARAILHLEALPLDCGRLYLFSVT
jgi:hypothetical protein